MMKFLFLISICIILVWTARRHAPTRDKIRTIFHGHVTWAANKTRLRATTAPVVETTSAPGNVKVLPPPWLRGEMEAPAGEKDMGGWTRGVFTPEQQTRLGVDENGINVTTAVPVVETTSAPVTTLAPVVVTKNAMPRKPDTKPQKTNICKGYPSIYSGELYEETLDIILHIQKVLSAANMEWTIAFGTSLGWKRGQTFTPYDDDSDIVIKGKDSEKFIQLFKPPFCTAKFWGGLKVFKCSRPSAGGYAWKTPFVDVWDGTHKYSKWKYKDSFMFPTRPTVFAGYIVQVSKNIEKHIAIKYPNPDNCKTLTWDHINERTSKNSKQTHPCSEVQKQCFSDKMDVYRYPPLTTKSQKQHGILYDMLQWLDNIASKYDIKYSLVYGTLLGWRREGHIISQDTDVDIQIGSIEIPKLVHLIDIGIAKAASEHGGINTNEFTLLVRKTHDRRFSDVQRTNCKGKPVSRMTDVCAFNGPIARVMFKGRHIDIYFRTSYVQDAPSKWHCRKHTGCVYSQSRYSIPLPEVYPCRLGPVDTKCFGPAIVKQHLNEIYGNEWVQVGKKIYY